MGSAAQSVGDHAGGGVIALLTLFLATAFPSTDKTSWMRPESFHLVIGMPRGDAVKALEENGWKLKPGDDPNHAVVDYGDDKALTLQFNRDRLHSIRFELFAILPEAHTAFAEEKAFLRRTLGEPKKTIKSKSILIYDRQLPNVMVVLNADPKSETAQRGLGILVVRYFDPR
jgi:hypothetical protein